jgi:hypothetical protein
MAVVKVVMLILGVLGVGALFAAFDAEEASERTFDLLCAAGAAAIITTWAIANRGRRKSLVVLNGHVARLPSIAM